MEQGKARRSAKARQSTTALLHLWLGLSVGLLLTICGLTGSYLTFHQQIERSALAELRLSPGVQPASYEAVYRTLTHVAPSAPGDWNIELPVGGGIITSRLPGKDGPRMVSIDPATLRVVRDVQWGETISTWLYELHYHLLMGRTGASVMGVAGIAIMVLLALGGVLWWRSGRSMRSRLSFRASGTGQRKLYDAHRLIGLASLLLLFISVLTAVAMSLPKHVRPMLAAVSPISRLSDTSSGSARGRPRMGIDRALAIARTAVPDGEVRWIRVPAKSEGAYIVRFWQPGEPSRRFPKSSVSIDQYDGRVLAIYRAPRGSISDGILLWLYPLHGGEAFGVAGRVIVALLGLVPAILFVTGLLRWRSKVARLAAATRKQAKVLNTDARPATIRNQ
ncbi:PepSY-associated TM helix domain-containing protein [Novosphingobium sp. BL-52-GroH]|uniref:PepSY-associated TM helix domain-containing protein n=1 Tax=Novosphingobium sp. BL-52-GroH TaxID=3349877 RepID=UPI00384E07E2